MTEAMAPGQSRRRKDADKAARILAAARRMFLDHGFEAAKMTEVARAAGVSKMTIYSHFGDKEALFEEVIYRESERIEAALAPDPTRPDGLAERLNGVGRRLLAVMLSEDFTALDRIVGFLAVSAPGLAKRAFEVGTGHMFRVIGGLIEEGVREGALRPLDPRMAADHLMSLWHGCTMDALRYGVIDRPAPAEIARRVEEGTAVFLRAYGAGPPGAS